jgi:hypothetical protein
MTRQSQISFRKIACILTVAMSLTTWATASFAFTAEQQAACSPDAFRLCSSEIPNIPGVTSCMRKQFSSLSPTCKAVFPK